MDQHDRNEIHDETGSTDVPHPAAAGPGRAGRAAGATGRAFVVELAPGATTADAFCGRVQHLATMDGGNFSSVESLIAIIRRVLERAQRDEIDE
jgi:hypothetical protein